MAGLIDAAGLTSLGGCSAGRPIQSSAMARSISPRSRSPVGVRGRTWVVCAPMGHGPWRMARGEGEDGGERGGEGGCQDGGGTFPPMKSGSASSAAQPSSRTRRARSSLRLRSKCTCAMGQPMCQGQVLHQGNQGSGSPDPWGGRKSTRPLSQGSATIRLGSATFTACTMATAASHVKAVRCRLGGNT